MARFWVLAIGMVAFLAAMAIRQPAASTVEWRSDVQAALAEAGERRTGVLVWFTTDGCLYCRQMDERVFPDSDVAALIERFVPLKIDVSRDHPLAERFNVEAIPAFVVLSGSDEGVSGASGYHDVAAFTTFLKNAGGKVWPSASLARSTSP